MYNKNIAATVIISPLYAKLSINIGITKAATSSCGSLNIKAIKTKKIIIKNNVKNKLPVMSFIEAYITPPKL